MRRYCNTVWLLQDDPEQARHELSQSSWSPPTDAFHLQHYFEWRANIYLMLYEDVEEQPMLAMRETFRQLNRSMLTRAIQGLRSEAHWLWGQVCLADAAKNGRGAGLRQAGKMARELLAEKRSYATAMGLLVRAGVEAQKGRKPQAIATLEAAASVARENDLVHMQMAADYQRGKLLGGTEQDQLSAAARDYWRSQGGVQWGKLSDLVAPGFRVRN